MKVKSLSRVWLFVTPWTAAYQAPPSMGFSRQEYWSGLPFPSPMHESEKWKWSHSVMSDSLWPHGLQPTRLLCPSDFPGKSTGVGCHCLLRQRMRWLDSIIDSMDTDLSKFRETVEDSGAWYAAIHGVTKSRTWLSNWTTDHSIIWKRQFLKFPVLFLYLYIIDNKMSSKLGYW